jgi:hypothetical protein
MTTTPSITTCTLTITSTTTTARSGHGTTGAARTRLAAPPTAPTTGRLLGVPPHRTSREVIDDPTRADT